MRAGPPPSGGARGMVDAGGAAMASSLVEAAVRAAVQAGAPRRTVAAAAGAVTTAVMAALRCGDGPARGAPEPAAAGSSRRQRKRQKKKDLAAAARQAGDEDSKRRRLEPAELGRGGDPETAAAGPNMEVEEADSWLPPPPADSDQEMEASRAEAGPTPGEPPELMAKLRLVRAQAQDAKEGKPSARERFADLPPWMFHGKHGRLTGPLLHWNANQSVYEFRVGDRTLKDEYLAMYTRAFEAITHTQLEAPSAPLEAGTVARGSAGSV